MDRREVMQAGGAALLARLAIAQPTQTRVLKCVPQAKLTSVDPS